MTGKSEKTKTKTREDWINRPAYLRQIADEMDEVAKYPPCTEASICRDAASEIETLRRMTYGEVTKVADNQTTYRPASTHVP